MINILLTVITFIIMLSVNNIFFSQNIHKKDFISYSIQNLDVSTFKDGSQITEAHNAIEWVTLNNEKKPCFCYYNFNEENNKKHGKLYNYWAIIHPSGIAPEGWHIPNIYEFQFLISGRKINDAEIKNNNNQIVNEISPFHFDMKIEDSIIINASSICEKNGIFFGTPYTVNPNYNWWSGGWWVNTSHVKNGLIALKVKSMIENNNVEPIFEADNIGNGYSVICIKDYERIEEYLDKDVDEIKLKDVTYKAKNLNTSKFRDGTPIVEAKNPQEWNNYNKLKKPAYCYYKYNKYYEVNYGKIYNYWAMSSPLGITPEGWHVPNMLELQYILGKTDIPNKSLKTTAYIRYGKKNCNPTLMKHEFIFQIEELTKLSVSNCDSIGVFNYSSYNDKQKDISYQGSWWTTNFSDNNIKKLKPFTLKINSNPYASYDLISNAVNFEESNFNEGCSIICFKDYPIDSAEIKRNIYIEKLKINNKLKIIDSITLELPTNNKIYLYTTKDSLLLSDFLFFGKTYVKSYINWGTLSNYRSNPNFKLLINSSLNNGLFLTKHNNIDWLNKKIIDTNKFIESNFRRFVLLIDMNNLPTKNEFYTLNIPELSYKQDLNIDLDGFAKCIIDSNFINSIEKMPFKSLNKNNATKELTFNITNNSNKNFAGIKKIFSTSYVNKSSIHRENDCKYIEYTNEIIQLTAKFLINYGSTNIMMHSLYIPIIDSIIQNGLIINAYKSYENKIDKLLPNYFQTNEDQWPVDDLKHKIIFDRMIAGLVYRLSKDPELFLQIYKKADIKNKYALKKLYYYFGAVSDNLTKSLLLSVTNIYYDYLLSSLLECTIGNNEQFRFGESKEAFNFNAPILFRLDEIDLDLSNEGSNDRYESIKWINKAIALEPNNPIAYTYRAKFKGCEKLIVYHNSCTVSEWCSGCKDLQLAVKLDLNRTKILNKDIVSGAYIVNIDTDNYYEALYKLDCVNCTLCFYNICGGNDKSIKTGSRGGKYYINKNGNKTYIKK